MEEGNSNTAKRITVDIVVSFIGIAVEVISLGCTLSFGSDYDETNSNLPYVSFILMACALCGQVFGCFVAGTLSKGTTEAAKCNEDLALFLLFFFVGLVFYPYLVWGCFNS